MTEREAIRAENPGGGAHQPPPGAGPMNVLRWALFAALVVVAVLSVTHWARTRGGAGGAAKSSSQAAHVIWRCPMHPSYTSDRPGECPICGMTLEKVETGGETQAGAGAGNVPGLTSVEITPERIQRIGVRTAIASAAAMGGGATLVGFVAPDESRLARVQLRVAGWVRAMRVGRTGERVTAGQPLLTLYSPELFQSEREYLIELGATPPGPAGTQAPGAPADTEPHAGEVQSSGGVSTSPEPQAGGMQGSGGAATSPEPHAESMQGSNSEHASHEGGATASGRLRLQRMGVPDEEIRRLERERTASDVVTLRSTVTGTVLERNAVDGQYVGADTPILSVADLSRVWVLVDLYEMDLGRLSVGDPVKFLADGLPERDFPGRVEFIYPTVSSETRTVKARFALENRDGALKPGMFGRVEISPHGRAAVTVPAEAVIRTGREDYVFLARAGGRFEPRRVHIGQADGDRMQILHGLAAGDTVVSSASFLIDSESRLKAAIAGLGGGEAGAAPPAHGHGNSK